MWPPLLKLLEVLGRIRLPSAITVKMIAGDANAPDAQGSTHWKQFANAERLHDAWAPVPGSAWEPFHCVTLFAALDRLLRDECGPTDPEKAQQIESVLGDHATSVETMPGWIGSGVMAFVDLPGPVSVALGARLVRAGMQPVCAFDNWPHPAGLLRPEAVLAQLLRFASTVHESRPGLMTSSPPVWLCDRDRFGQRPGRPREFDNRYYLDDSILPGIDILRREGVHTIVCVQTQPGDTPLDDLRYYFGALQKSGFEVLTTGLSEPHLQLVRLNLVDDKKPTFDNFRRSSAGGFGSMIPEPSSGSGG